jgi:pre-mRNA-splicing factor CDC5/CEF1
MKAIHFRLVLPAPQVTEEDVQEIVKLGVSGEAARSMVEGGDAPANFLSNDGFKVPMATRTPRLAADNSGDVLKAMARNLKALTESQTPLLGGDVELEGTMQFTATPQRGISSTPNPLLDTLQGTPREATQEGSTPRVPVLGKTPSSSRDVMGINTPRDSAGFDETPRTGPISHFGQKLSSLFAALPAPKNDFEIVLPDLDLEADTEGEESRRVEDNEVIATRLEEERRAEMQRQLSLRSQVLQRGLVRPIVSLDLLTSMYGEEEEESCGVEEMIAKEKAILLYHDAINYPIAGQSVLGSFYAMERLDEYLDQAAHLIQVEYEGEEHPFIHNPLIFQDYDLDPSGKKIVKVEEMSGDLYHFQYQALLEEMKTRSMSSQKLEKKLSVTLGGYIMKRRMMSSNFMEGYESLSSLRLDLETFSLLRDREEELIRVRLADENRELQRLAMMEQELQDRYRELTLF